MKDQHSMSEVKDGEKYEVTPGDVLSDTARQDKEPKRTLFNNLSQFKNTYVSIITFGGEIVKGNLVCYDEVANCVVESKKDGRMLVFGKSITMVCEGEVSLL